MKIAICDEDFRVAQLLHECINEIPQEYSLCVYGSTDNLLADYRCGKRYDLVFMDIQTEEHNAILAAETLTNNFYGEKPLIVFLTQPDNYINSAHWYAWWCMHKPIEKEELSELLEHARYNLEDFSILIETTIGTCNIEVKDIIYLEAYYGKAKIYTVKQEYTTNLTLAAVAQMLPKRLFFQSHRSYYINFGHVASYNKKLIILSNYSEVHLSRNRRQAFINELKGYIQSKRITVQPQKSTIELKHIENRQAMRYFS